MNKDGKERRPVKRDTTLERTLYGMRNDETVESYIKLMASLIQGVVTFKRFKMNRTIKPFSEWVTVSDEAFLLLCLENYGASWRAEVHGKQNKTAGTTKNREQSNEQTTIAAKYTGRDKGTRVGWSEIGIKVFNNAMLRVFLDRENTGKEFDDQFMVLMKDRHDPKPVYHQSARAIAKQKALLAQANARSRNRQIILNDHNIAQHIEKNRELIEQRLQQAISEDCEENDNEMLDSSSGGDDNGGNNDDSDDDEEKGSSVYQL